ncbi:MAG: transaldolase family protein [Candidatus Komeilibacteria bacterium]|nr:transaldolase family protein [Candidatus Komeilibacteria bacterium]
MKTKIFLDSGDPAETKQTLDLLGYLDGQTTNPSLIVKHPDAQARFQSGQKFSQQEILDFYKKVIQQISAIIPAGSVSVEVYADAQTTAQTMIEQAREMNQWIPNAWIKLPTTSEGLKAAHELSQEGMRLNLTLCFSQEQAAAVYAATKGAGKGDIFVSPFIGRLDDRGENGMDLIANIVKMYQAGDGHVEVLTASVRNQDHFLEALRLQTDIITAPLKAIQPWAEAGQKVPGNDYIYPKGALSSIPYQEISLDQDWSAYNIQHDLTDKGLEKFASDWNALIG